MRDRVERDAFGLILGAGVSKAVGFPQWSELVNRIASHPEVDGNHLLVGAGSTVSDTAKTQMLLQHYRTKRLDALSIPRSAKVDRKINGEWRRIVQAALYEGVPEAAEELRDRHPYLSHFVPLVAKAPMTVTYNFDDMLERLVRLHRPDRDGRYGARSRVFGAHRCSQGEARRSYTIRTATYRRTFLKTLAIPSSSPQRRSRTN